MSADDAIRAEQTALAGQLVRTEAVDLLFEAVTVADRDWTTMRALVATIQQEATAAAWDEDAALRRAACRDQVCYCLEITP